MGHSGILCSEASKQTGECNEGKVQWWADSFWLPQVQDCRKVRCWFSSHIYTYTFIIFSSVLCLPNNNLNYLLIWIIHVLFMFIHYYSNYCYIIIYISSLGLAVTTTMNLLSLPVVCKMCQGLFMTRLLHLSYNYGEVSVILRLWYSFISVVLGLGLKYHSYDLKRS